MEFSSEIKGTTTRQLARLIRAGMQASGSEALQAVGTERYNNKLIQRFKVLQVCYFDNRRSLS